jgi:hypothetical protein
MSVQDKPSIAVSLARATCTLLGTAISTPVLAQEEPGWDFNTALLYYGESDNRVQDISLNVLARKTLLDDRFLTLGLAVDTLTGATPGGALPFSGPQTFTRPSGLSTYTTPGGQIPLDDSFLDTRVAISAGWTQPFARLYKFNAGISASKEYDYLHLGADLGFARDFNKRNTTLSFGLAFSQDSLEPVGGAPLPLSAMLDVGDLSNRTGDQDKTIVDAVIGLTQVINRDLLVQVNYSFSQSTGYLNDPYKFLSLVDGSSGDPIERTPAPGESGPDYEYRYENRPDERTKHSLYTQAKYHMNGKVLDASYRYMTDDWDIRSQTIEARYRWPIGDSRYLEPHLRYYTQTAAEFYRISLVDGAPPLEFASADYRLGDFDAITIGLKYGWKTRRDNEMSVRLEYYMQDGTAPTDQVIGNQSNYSLYPDLDAIIAQFSYRF